MFPFLSSPPPQTFSSCSISYLNQLYSDGNDFCLFNVPTDVVGDPPECGNGILEEGEVCDCGTPEECTNNCCDATTCQPVVGAECFTGACCTSQCTIASYGTECRASTGDCDIAEYCLGSSNECPVDEVVVNGVSCGSDGSHCLNGKCPPTLQAQCDNIFPSKDTYCKFML